MMYNIASKVFLTSAFIFVLCLFAIKADKKFVGKPYQLAISFSAMISLITWVISGFIAIWTR